MLLFKFQVEPLGNFSDKIQISLTYGKFFLYNSMVFC